MNALDTDFYAVVVGVGAYVSNNLQDLPATATDARLLREVLIDPLLCRYPPERTRLLTGASATLAGFRDELAWLAREARSTSTALIYFSGHGGRMELPLEAAASHESFLCLREAEPSRLRETALSATEFGEALRRIHAGRLVVILDSCFAAGAASFKAAEPSAGAWREGLTSEAIERLGKGAGRVAIASSSASQVSLVREQGDVSLFTYHLLDALRGAAGVRRDGYVHVLDVFHYVSEAVREQAPRQTPILKADDLDRNFPIAFDHGGKPQMETASSQGRLTAIREGIIAEPEAGAESLSQYLSSLQEKQAQRTRVDQLRADLLSAQREIATSHSAEARAERSRIIYLLLDVCARVERGDLSVPPPAPPVPAPAQPAQPAPAGPHLPFQVTITAGKMENTTIAQSVTNTHYHTADRKGGDSEPNDR